MFIGDEKLPQAVPEKKALMVAPEQEKQRHQNDEIFRVNHDPPIQFTSDNSVLFDSPFEELSLAQEEQQRPLVPSLLFPLSLRNEQNQDAAHT